MGSDISEANESAPLRGAGFWIRVLARILDLIYGSILGFFSGFVSASIFLFIFPSVPSKMEPTMAVFLVGFALVEVGAILYHSVCDSYFGASLGKLICGLRVTDLQGARCTLRSAIIRELVFYIDSLFLGLVGYVSMSRSNLKQRFGDVWGRTLVIRASDVPDNYRTPGSQFIKIFAISSLIWAFFIMISIFTEAL